MSKVPLVTMQCPVGHPPGPQEFCPLCGRRGVPAPRVEQPAEPAPPPLPVEPVPPPVELLPPPAEPVPPPAELVPPPVEPAAAEPVVTSWQPVPPPPASPPTGGPGHGAAAKAQQLIAELSGSAPPAPAAGPPAATELPGPPAATELPGPPAPHAPDAFEPGAWAEPAGQDPAALPTGHRPNRPSRLRVMLAVGALLLAGGYLAKTQLSDGTANPAPPTSAPAVVRPGGVGPSTLAASLQNAHFRHGCQAGKARGAVLPADRQAACRALALRQRTGGYPWGAHDQAGCLAALGG